MPMDRTTGWLAFGRPQRDAEGGFAGYIGSCYDVTERRLGDQALRDYTVRLGGLRQLDEAVLAIQEPEAIARTALQHVRRMMPCAYASVVAFDLDRQQSLILALDSLISTRFQAGATLPLAQFGPLVEMKRDRASVYR